jgi:aldehyde dehydrogenase (NAD+)
MNEPSGKLVNLRQYFDSGTTKSYDFRVTQLRKLKKAIIGHEQDLYNALFADLKKSPEETWVTENGIVLSELNTTIKNLRRWMAPEKVGTNLLNLPSGSRVMKEPLGVVLIIAPWNYPFNLLMIPLVGAIAAGNCVVLKASEFAPHTAGVMRKIIEETFPPEYVQFMDGDGAVEVPSLMNHFRFDHVFYTGSTVVGKIIYKMAAEKLTPVTLELGGKSPCIVEADADIKVAARRIAVTKFSNAGQMCVAPDYILVHESKKEELITLLKKNLVDFFGENAMEGYGYCKIINEKQFDRVTKYLAQGELVHGGRTDRSSLYIEPTIITNIPSDATIMAEEIFGPLLPVIGFTDPEEAKSIINKNNNPLALYIFTSSNKKEKYWLENVAAGGACVNNASWHLTNPNLPFGGRGFSGTGNYHGRYSFETFSHKKAVMKTPTWFDPNIKYPPFKGKLKIFKWVIR